MKKRREREVYLYLFDHANADGFVSASGIGIGKALGLDPSTVCVHLRKLETRGELYRLDTCDDEGLTRFAVTALVGSSE